MKKVQWDGHQWRHTTRNEQGSMSWSPMTPHQAEWTRYNELVNNDATPHGRYKVKWAGHQWRHTTRKIQGTMSCFPMTPHHTEWTRYNEMVTNDATPHGRYKVQWAGRHWRHTTRLRKGDVSGYFPEVRFVLWCHKLECLLLLIPSLVKWASSMNKMLEIIRG